MSETDSKVMSMVERELKKKPDATVDELFTKAKAINASVGNLTKRQFHAKYPLQVKRRKGSGGKAKSTKSAPKRKSRAKKKTAAKSTSSAPKASGRSKTRAKPKTTRRSRSKKAAPAASGPDREKVRSVLLGFASDLAAAEQRKDLVKVLAGVDRYVDRVIKASN